MNFEVIKKEARTVAIYEYNRGVGRKFYIKTFGCQQNEADSEKIAGILLSLGYAEAAEAESADLIILNTCSVRAHAEDKAFSTLGAFRALKRKREELIVGVVGCMGANSVAVDKLKRDFHYVSFTLGAGAMHKLPEALYSVIFEGKRCFIPPKERESIVEGIPARRSSAKSAFVSIMYGCDNFCSYCIVPYTRGRERSRQSEEIIKECRELVDGGASEITLLGQNVNSYRADMNFAELLEAVAKISTDFTLKFMTSHPKDVSPGLISVMKKYPEKIARAFHLPLQSGSDTVLSEMNRKYTRESFISTAEMIRREIPDVYLTTDVIVGFPGESEKDFAETLGVLERVRFDAVYAFIYSAREGTPAAKSKDTVDEEIKKARISRLLEFQDGILLEKNRAFIGSTVSVFAESATPGERAVGRTREGRAVHFDAKRAFSEKETKVKITSVGAYGLFGVEVI